MAEHNQQFDNFQQWVNKAPSWLTRRGTNVHAICYDTKGRLCRIGGDFMRARDENAFPVRWLWPEQVAKLAVHLQERATLEDIISADYERLSVSYLS